MKVFSCGFNLKLLKYIKRTRVDEEEGSENESKLSEPSTSEAEKEATDKENPPLQRQFLGRGFYMDRRRKLPPSGSHCVRDKTIKYGRGPGKVKLTLDN
jgi:hypothetical protein